MLVADISHAIHAMIKDFCNRSEKNDLRKKARATIDAALLANYSTVEITHPFIERDLADHLSLNDRHLPDALTTPTLLKPMFGSKESLGLD